MRYFAVVFIAICCFACDNEVEPASDNTVHLAGYVGVADLNMVASYWRDGNYARLTTNGTSSGVNSLSVDGSAVLIGGWHFTLGESAHPVYWRNGDEIPIEESWGSTTLVTSLGGSVVGVWPGPEFSGTWVFNQNGTTQPIIDTVLDIGPTDVALLGDDVYIAGGSIGADQNQHAQCWKNGKLIFRESEISNAMSLFVHKNDIYLAGYLHGSEYPNGIACYWKNGERVALTDGSVIATAWSIVVTEDHVYLSGAVDQQATYWKDGEPTTLTDGATYANARCIAVRGDDIYVGGYVDGFPAYWKNDVKQRFEKDDEPGQIRCISVGSD